MVTPADGVAGPNPRPPTTVVVPALQGSVPVCTADVNHDGTLDIVFASAATGSLQYLPRVDPQSAMYAPSLIGLIDSAMPQGTPGPAACGDVDGDGNVDIVMSWTAPAASGESASTLALYLNPSGGTGFQRVDLAPGFPAGVIVGGQSLADFDRDGRQDLVVYAANQGLLDSQIFVFPNSGIASQPFSSATRVSVPLTGVLATAAAPSWGALTTMDWDGDGLPDIWALGNRGALFLYLSAGGFQFSEPVFEGQVSPLPAKFTITSQDGDGDGIPDLFIENTDPDVLASLPEGTFIMIPIKPAPPPPPPPPPPPRPVVRGTPVPVVHKVFTPFFSGSEEVGLVKGSPVATTYFDAGGIEQPSIFMQAVNGHLVERLRYTRHIPAYFVTSARGIFQFAPPIGVVVCISTFCDSGSGTLTPLTDLAVTSQDVWVWVDHGVPHQTFSPAHQTIVASQPAVVMDESGATVRRMIFVRGLDGHLWELDEQDGQESWTDWGISPQVRTTGHDPLDPSPGTSMPFVGSPSVVTQRMVGQQPVPLVSILDAAGRLNYFQDGQDFTWQTPGRIGKGNCFGAIGALGSGSPKAISWFDVDPVSKQLLQHFETFVVGSLGDLFSWHGTADPTTNFGPVGSWEESQITQYQLNPNDVLGSAIVDKYIGAPGSPDGVPHVFACPNDPQPGPPGAPINGSGQPLVPGSGDVPGQPPTQPYNYHPPYRRVAAAQGTPDALVWKLGSVLTRSVFVRGADSSILYEYRFQGQTPVAPASLLSPPEVVLRANVQPLGYPADAPPLPVGSVTQRGQHAALTKLSNPFCNIKGGNVPANRPQGAPDFFSSDPVVVQDSHQGVLSVLATNEFHDLIVAHSSTTLPSPSPWNWEYRPSLNQYRARTPFSPIVATPAALATAGAVDVFAVFSNGFLHAARGTAAVDTATAFQWASCRPDTLCSPPDNSCGEGAFSWDVDVNSQVPSHAVPNAPQVLDNQWAKGGSPPYAGQCNDTDALDDIMPQWGDVEGQRFDLTGAYIPILYDPPRNFETGGADSETLREVEGVVVASHIAATDTPINHSLGFVGDIPRVRHDWNIIIAPDIRYQDQITDANILDGGTMELEWEMGDHLKPVPFHDGNSTPGLFAFQDMNNAGQPIKATTAVIPAVGDRVAVRGRHIYDCGHPPYRAEIHPIDALAVIHGSMGQLRFSNDGGRTWFLKDDANSQISGDRTHVCEPQGTFSSFIGAASAQAVHTALFVAGCQRTFDSCLLAPNQNQDNCPSTIATAITDPTCYQEYLHGMTDIITDPPPNVAFPTGPTYDQNNPPINVPLVFDIPGTGMPADPGALLNLQSMSQAVGGPNPYVHVSIPASSMPTVPETMYFAATHPDMPRVFQVCFQWTEIIGHDSFSADSLVQQVAALPFDWVYAKLDPGTGLGPRSLLAIPTAILHVVPILGGLEAGLSALLSLGCAPPDFSDEPLVVVSANDQTKLYESGLGMAPRPGLPDTNCLTVSVFPGETLNVSAHGFECDFSCGEHWDDNFVTSPDDSIGTVHAAFTEAQNYGVGAIETPNTYTLWSQPNLTSPLSRVNTNRDYSLKIQITELGQ